MMRTFFRRRQIPAQGLFERAASPARAAEQNSFRRQHNRFLRVELAPAHKAFVPELGAFEHVVKRRRQFRRQRAFDFQSHVAPAVIDAVALVIRRNVEPADERHPLVADEQLAMIANRQPPQGNRVEHAHLAARLLQRLPKGVGQKNRADGVHQHPHLHAAFPRTDQCFQKFTPQRTFLEGAGDANLSSSPNLRKP